MAQTLGFGVSVSASTTALAQSLNAPQTAIANDLPARVSGLVNGMLASFNSEADRFNLAKQSYLASVDGRVQSVLNGLVTDHANQMAIVAAESAYIFRVNSSLNAELSSFASTIVDTSAVDASLSSTVADTSSAITMQLSVAIADEITRVTNAEAEAASSITFRIEYASGNTDFSLWFAS